MEIPFLSRARQAPMQLTSRLRQFLARKAITFLCNPPSDRRTHSLRRRGMRGAPTRPGIAILLFGMILRNIPIRFSGQVEIARTTALPLLADNPLRVPRGIY